MLNPFISETRIQEEHEEDRLRRVYRQENPKGELTRREYKRAENEYVQKGLQEFVALEESID